MSKQSTFLDSMRFAWAGVGHAISKERNMKLHVIASVMVSVVGMSLHFDMASRAALLISVALVWFAEILNTALEAFVDLHIQEFHRSAKVAKDGAAAAVLVAAAATVLIFSDILHENWDQVRGSPEAVWRGVLFGIPLTVCLSILLFSIKPRGQSTEEAPDEAAPQTKSSGVLIALLGLLSLGLYIPLALNSANFIFALLGLVVILVSIAVARQK
jgi:diacylglycerol kinase